MWTWRRSISCGYPRPWRSLTCQHAAALQRAQPDVGDLGPEALSLLGIGFFVLSFAIASIAVMAGIGGGVLFTPIMLAFTPVDSLIIRGTGLVVAMFSGLVSSGPFMRSGLGNLKLSLYSTVGYGAGALFGAQGAVLANERLGEANEAVVRLTLGAIVFSLVFYFYRGGEKIEWPRVDRVDPFTRWLGLTQSYYEESTRQITEYRVTRAGLGAAAMVGIGSISGFYGLGAGWAIVPVMNLVMGVPIKVAAACSGIVVGMGDSVSVWPYFFAGAIIPLFAALWLAGQVLGGIVGARILIKVRAGTIRVVLVGILLFAGFGLVLKGLTTLGYLPKISDGVSLGVLLLISAGVVLGMTGKLPTFGSRR